MHTVQRGPGVSPRASTGVELGVGLAGQLVVLLGLEAAVDLGVAGWLVGTGCGLLTTAFLAHGLGRRSARGLGPADRVTLFRATLVGGVAAMTAGSFGSDGQGTPWVLVAVTTVALGLDWVDGQVARRTRTVSELGARFDMEVDALLILILSVHVSRSVGAWVLLIGAARYLRLLARGPLPWMRLEAPARYWSKVVAATQGVVLTTVAASVLPAPLAVATLVVAVGLLAESFGRETWWLWRHRPGDAAVEVGAPDRAAAAPGAEKAAA